MDLFSKTKKKSIVAVSAAGGFLLQFAWACQLANAPWAVSLSRCQIEADAVMLRACEFWGFSFKKKKISGASATVIGQRPASAKTSQPGSNAGKPAGHHHHHSRFIKLSSFHNQ